MRRRTFQRASARRGAYRKSRKRIHRQSGRRGAKVAVALIGKNEKTVMLDAGAVKYDPARNEILAQQSGDQIKSLSSAG
jgi:hypothetical protein